MEILATILVILHFVGLSLLLGGFFSQIKEIAKGTGRVLRIMLDGAYTQLVTGLALVGLYSAAKSLDEDVNEIKVGVKLVVLIAILVIALIFRKREIAPSWALWTIGGLTLLNLVLAVAW